MSIGTVLRSHAGGYLVYQSELDQELLCTARGRLKKEHVTILAGDRVELDDIKPELGQAHIVDCLERKNVLSRPPLANIDQVFIVQAIHQPEWHPLWCDRYLVHFQLELPDASFVLCFNKCDLADEDDMKALRHTYESLGYELIIVSAYTGVGLDKLKSQLSGKLSILAGPSGVGKSTLLNALKPGLNLKTGIMENEYGVGRHTTTATEIYRLSDSDEYAVEQSAARSRAQRNGDQAESARGPKPKKRLITWVGDTPGFSLSELTHAQPEKIAPLFPEIRELAATCKYADCLHIVEQECNVLANLGQINKERYRSYMALVEEAREKQKLEQSRSTKLEGKVKMVGGKNAKKIPRLQKQYRGASRRQEKQKMGARFVETENQS